MENIIHEPAGRIVVAVEKKPKTKYVNRFIVGGADGNGGVANRLFQSGWVKTHSGWIWARIFAQWFIQEMALEENAKVRLNNQLFGR